MNLHTFATTIIDSAQALLRQNCGTLTPKQNEIIRIIIANAERFLHIYAEFQSMPFDQFAVDSEMRHEFGTPLTPIRGYAELMLMGALGDFTAEQRTHVEAICETIDQLGMAVDAILKKARREVAALQTA